MLSSPLTRIFLFLLYLFRFKYTFLPLYIFFTFYIIFLSLFQSIYFPFSYISLLPHCPSLFRINLLINIIVHSWPCAVLNIFPPAFFCPILGARRWSFPLHHLQKNYEEYILENYFKKPQQSIALPLQYNIQVRYVDPKVCSC